MIFKSLYICRAYTGRGAFETIGAGLPMSPGEIGFKCNFAHADLETGRVIHRRVDKDFSAEARELCEYLQKELNQKGNWLDVEGISVNIKYATEHRCGIKIGKAGMSLSDEISGTDPLYDE
jgi:2,3-bisphosphoglycerate-independent phosphoglycerate mutase